jgi:hypothetical protein
MTMTFLTKSRPAMAGIAADAPIWTRIYFFLLDILRMLFPGLPIPIP